MTCFCTYLGCTPCMYVRTLYYRFVFEVIRFLIVGHEVRYIVVWDFVQFSVMFLDIFVNRFDVIHLLFSI